MNRPPTAATTASAARASFLSTLTPSGVSAKVRRISAATAVTPATVAASTRPEAHREDPSVLRRLMQLYLYDLGTIDGWDLGDDGLYGIEARIEGFWTDPNRRSFLVRVDGKLAGFALVRDGAHFAGDGTREISEFFILRRYRRRGAGERVARRVFDMFPGRWAVTE